MTTITIPATLDAAVDQLGAIGKIVTARNWERAAILATYVMPDAGSGGRVEVASSSHLVSARVFASHGIHGLRSKDTVIRYVTAWLAVRPRPIPGDSVNLNDLPDWPPDLEAPGRNITDETRRDRLVKQAEEDGTGASKVIDIASNPKAMEAAIKGDPEVALAAARALSARPELQRPPSTPEGRKARDDIKASIESIQNIDLKVLQACRLLQEAQVGWEDYYPTLPEAQRRHVDHALYEITVIAETLKMNVALEA